MNSDFLLGVESVRPVQVNSNSSQDPEIIWMAFHKDYDWFCGYGRNQVSAVNHLERLVNIVEKHKNRDEQVYSVMKAQLVEE